MRLDLTVNMFTMQALMNGVITVHGGQQYRPSIHIDDMTDLYLFMLDHPELTGIYNAGFENHRLSEIADKISHHTGAAIEVTDQKDARSYQVNSDKLLATGFRPKKNIDRAILEMMSAYREGTLLWKPQNVNLTWMQHLGIRDE
jgi:nucleoside-diphosphate-sugar epimerase